MSRRGLNDAQLSVRASSVFKFGNNLSDKIDDIRQKIQNPVMEKINEIKQSAPFENRGFAPLSRVEEQVQEAYASVQQKTDEELAMELQSRYRREFPPRTSQTPNLNPNANEDEVLFDRGPANPPNPYMYFEKIPSENKDK